MLTLLLILVIILIIAIVCFVVFGIGGLILSFVLSDIVIAAYVIYKIIKEIIK